MHFQLFLDFNLFVDICLYMWKVVKMVYYFKITNSVTLRGHLEDFLYQQIFLLCQSFKLIHSQAKKLLV